MFKILTLIISILGLNACYAETSQEHQTCKLVWSDEFNGETLDMTKWGFDIGDGCDRNLCGWGNKEKQWYQSENAVLQDGKLQIHAKKEASKDKPYTSSRLTTKGKFFQQYGRFEARIKTPGKRGLWPAFWLLPQDSKKSWPLNGEIDIMEQSGGTWLNLRELIGAIHFGERWPQNTHYSESLLKPEPWGAQYHSYRVDWAPDHIRWSVDDKVYGMVTPKDMAPYEWPFDRMPFYLLLNVAMGGNLGGTIPEDYTDAIMSVDYVRVYEGCEATDSLEVLP